MKTIIIAETVIFFMLLLFSAATDIKRRIIPNGVIILLAANTFLFRIIRIICCAEKSSELKSLSLSFISAVAIFIFLLIFVSVADKIACCETMGGGDIKLLSVIVFFFGIPKGIIAIFLSCVVGVILHTLSKIIKKVLSFTNIKSTSGNTQNKTFPFAPAVMIASFITAVYGDIISSWYMSLFI